MRLLRPGMLLCLTLLVPCATAAERAKAGRLLSDSAGVLMREKPGTPWRPVLKGEEIPTEELLVALPGAVLESTNKAVQLKLMSDIDRLSPLPVMESAVILHETREADLDFTLDRGRVDVINARAKGEAKVRVRFHKTVWDLTLEEPGTRVALEIYGRWLPGSRFTSKPGPKDAPLTHLVMLVIKGKVNRKCPVAEHGMSAPPGPAQLEWDSIHGQDKRVQQVVKLPEWGTIDEPGVTERGKMVKAMLDGFRDEIRETSVDSAIKKYLKSDKPMERQLGINAAAALDMPQHLRDTLMEGKNPDAWDHAVIAMRHWLGRAPGQEQRLYTGLTEERKMTPAQAETAIDLLFGFSEVEEGRPEIYEVLIDALTSEHLMLRGLAYWHLKRLAPLAKIEFNPASDKEEWEKAQKAFRIHIPRGKLPPLVPPDDKKN